MSRDINSQVTIDKECPICLGQMNKVDENIYRCENCQWEYITDCPPEN